MLLTLNLRRYKQSIAINAKENIIKITPIIIFQIYFPYQPIGLSIRTSIPETKSIALPKPIAPVAITFGQYLTDINHKIPTAKANKSDKRITSYVFKNLHF